MEVPNFIEQESSALAKQRQETVEKMNELQALAAREEEILAAVTELGQSFSGFMHATSRLIRLDPQLAQRLLSGIAAEIDSQVVHVLPEHSTPKRRTGMLGVSPFVMGLLGKLAKAQQLPTSFTDALKIAYQDRANTVMRHGFKEGLRTSFDNLKSLYADPSRPALTPMRNLMHNLQEAFAEQGGIDSVLSTADGWLTQLNEQRQIEE